MDTNKSDYLTTHDEDLGVANLPRVVLPSSAMKLLCPSKHSHNQSVLIRTQPTVNKPDGRKSDVRVDATNVPQEPKSAAKGRATLASTSRVSCVNSRNKDKEAETEFISIQHFSNICSVQSVDMRASTLSEFPPELINAQELKSLRLDQNHIKTIPPSISKLSNLEILSFSHNDIKSLTCGLGALKKLKALALDNNKLEQWPTWVCSELSQLRLLYLHGNPGIPGIPLAFAEMNQLERFSLDWFVYIQPETGAILKSDTGKILISETRCLCRKILQDNSMNNGDKENLGEVGHCSFLTLFQALALKKKTRLDQSLHIYPKRRSILHIACKLGHPTIVKELIDAGYDLNSVDVENSTALTLSIQNNTLDCSKLLLKVPSLEVNLTPPPLLLAIKNGRYDLAELIANHPSANVMVKDLSGNTALHLLFDRFDTYPQLIGKVCASILRHRDCRVNELNEALFTPLHLAAIYRQQHAIRFASEHNARCAARKNGAADDLFDFSAVGGHESLNVLHDIASRCDVETLFAALQNHVDVFARDSSDRLARDVVKDGMAAKLLLKKERSAMRERVSKDFVISHKRVFSLATDHQTETLPNSTKKPVFKLAEEQNVAAHTGKYSSPTPNMFRLMHFARNHKNLVLSQANLQEHHDCTRKSQPCPDVFEYCTAAKDASIKDTEMNGGKDVDEFNENEDLSTERKSASLMCRPSIVAKNYTFCKARADLTICTATAEESRILSHNKYTKLYKLVMQNEIPRSKKYRIVYYLFSKRSRDSKDILGVIFRKLPCTEQLKQDVGNLLSVIDGCEEKIFKKVVNPKERHSMGGRIFKESLVVDRPSITKSSSKLEKYSSMKQKILSDVQNEKRIPVFHVKNAFSYFSSKKK